MHRDVVIDSDNLLPLGVSPDGQLIYWHDVGGCAFNHSLFHIALESWERLHGAGADYETRRSFVEQAEIGIDGIAPTAFVFHMSRCGSTLLANVMAANDRIAVMSEPPVINPLLRALCSGKLGDPITEPAHLQVLRNVIAALGRRRRAEQQHFVVKFSSWNLLQARAVQSVFPGVPCLFLYREPAEVMVSLLKRPPGWLEGRSGAVAASLAGPGLDALLPVEYTARILQGVVRAGLDIADACFLNYTEVGRAGLPVLLRRLGIEVGAAELARMEAQFDLDAKSPSGRSFVDDRSAKQLAATGEIGEVAAHLLGAEYAALENSAQNLRHLR